MTSSDDQPQPPAFPSTQQQNPLPAAPAYAPPAAPAYGAPAVYQTVGQKSFVVTWLFSLLLGGFAVDRFYLGKVGTGILKLVTFSGFGIWYLVDLILVLANAQTDKGGNKLAGYEANKKVAWIITGAFIVLSGISSLLSGLASLLTT